jgi:hypothetical protein
LPQESTEKENTMVSKFYQSNQMSVQTQRSSRLRNRAITTAIAAGLVVVAGSAISPARGAVALVDFETTPALSTGPSIYVAVPGPQTIVTAPATFSGGVVLGFATFFPAISFATVPNVYGTADFGNRLSETLNMAIDPAFTATEVSFALFNGEVFNQSYAINGFNGTTLVASQTLNSIVPNFNSGYGLVDLVAAGGITSVTVAPVGAPSSWDFLVDTVAFNENITNVIPPTVLPPTLPPNLPPAPPVQGRLHGHGETEALEVDFGDDVNDIRGSSLVVPAPEPGSFPMMLAGLGLLGFMSVRRRRQVA